MYFVTQPFATSDITKIYFVLLSTSKDIIVQLIYSINKLLVILLGRTAWRSHTFVSTGAYPSIDAPLQSNESQIKSFQFVYSNTVGTLKWAKMLCYNFYVFIVKGLKGR